MANISGRMTVTRNDEPVELEITGRYNPSEPDVGIMSPWAEEIIATRPGSHEPEELTEGEELRAQDILLANAADYVG